MTEINGKLYFNASFGSVETGMLYSSDGTAAGTHLVATNVMMAQNLAATWASVKNDFNDDASSDILLNSGATLLSWSIKDGAIAGATSVGSIPDGWAMVKTGDFNGDGTADILIRHSTHGWLYDYTVHNGAVSGGSYVGDATGWTIVGSGDFNGDGTTDILLQNNTYGWLADWLMQSDGAGGARLANANLLGTLTTGWSVAGTGDFDGDGTSDILLKYSNGWVAEWTMQSGAASGSRFIGTANAGWTIAGTGDFNADNTDDILLQYSNGILADWVMQGGAAISSGVMGTGSAGTTVVGTGFYHGVGVGGSGASDILLQNNGLLIDYGVNNSLVTSGQVLGTATGWTVM